jgi:hypothetical protein
MSMQQREDPSPLHPNDPRGTDRAPYSRDGHEADAHHYEHPVVVPVPRPAPPETPHW